MPTQKAVQGTIVVNFTSAELNALLISAAETFLGLTIGQANIYMINSDGDPMASPAVIRTARVLVLNVVPS